MNVTVPNKKKSPKLLIDASLGVIQSISQHDKMLTSEEIAEVLNMSPKTIYAQAKTGKLPAIRIGQSVRFDPKNVADWLSARAA